jgi:hypothetical protein
MARGRVACEAACPMSHGSLSFALPWKLSRSHIVREQRRNPSPLVGEGGAKRRMRGVCGPSPQSGSQRDPHAPVALLLPLTLPLLRNGPLPLPQGERGILRDPNCVNPLAPCRGNFRKVPSNKSLQTRCIAARRAA